MFIVDPQGMTNVSDNDIEVDYENKKLIINYDKFNNFVANKYLTQAEINTQPILPPGTIFYHRNQFSKKTILVIERPPEIKTLTYSNGACDYHTETMNLHLLGIITKQEHDELVEGFEESLDKDKNTIKLRLQLPYIYFCFVFHYSLTNDRRNELSETKVFCSQQKLESLSDPIYALPLNNISAEMLFCHNVSIDSSMKTTVEVTDAILDAFYTKTFNSDYNSNRTLYNEKGNLLSNLVYWHMITAKEPMSIGYEKFIQNSYYTTLGKMARVANKSSQFYNGFMEIYKKINNHYPTSYVYMNKTFLIGDEILYENKIYFIESFIVAPHNQEDMTSDVKLLNIQVEDEDGIFSGIEGTIENLKKITISTEGGLSRIFNDVEFTIGDFIICENNSGIITDLIFDVLKRVVLNNNKVFYLNKDSKFKIIKNDQQLEEYFGLVKGKPYLLILNSQIGKYNFKNYEYIEYDNFVNFKLNSNHDMSDIKDIISIGARRLGAPIRYGMLSFDPKYYYMFEDNNYIIRNDVTVNNQESSPIDLYLSDEDKCFTWLNFDGTTESVSVGDKIAYYYDGMVKISNIIEFVRSAANSRISIQLANGNGYTILSTGQGSGEYLIYPYNGLKVYDSSKYYDLKKDDRIQLKVSQFPGFFKKDFNAIMGFVEFKGIELAIMSNGLTLFTENIDDAEAFDIYSPHATPTEPRRLKKWKSVMEKPVNYSGKGYLHVARHEFCNVDSGITLGRISKKYSSRTETFVLVNLSYSSSGGRRVTIPFPKAAPENDKFNQIVAGYTDRFIKESNFA